MRVNNVIVEVNILLFAQRQAEILCALHYLHSPVRSTFYSESVRSGDACSREAVSPHHPSYWLQRDAGCLSCFLNPQLQVELTELCNGARAGTFTCRYLKLPCVQALQPEKKPYGTFEVNRFGFCVAAQLLEITSLIQVCLRASVALCSGLTGYCRLYGGMSAWLAPGEPKLWCPHA